MQAIEEKPKEDTRPDTMTTMEMGKRLRVDGHTIVRWINQGLMPGGRVGDTYRTDRETFEKWYAERFTGGNVEENPRRTQTEE